MKITVTGKFTQTGKTTTFTTPLPLISGDTGVFAGGVDSGILNTMDYINISTTANAWDFGDLTVARYRLGGTSNGGSERGLTGGGNTSGDTIDYVTINTAGDATDFGNLTAARQKGGALSNGSNDRGVFTSGSGGANVLDWVTISSAGNAIDFGDSTIDSIASGPSGTSNGTSEKGIFSIGLTAGSTPTNVIDTITVSSAANATDYGDLLTALHALSSALSSDTDDRAVFGGGYNNGATQTNAMEYVTISSGSNTTDFGDLSLGKYDLAATSNGTGDRGVFGGGWTKTGNTTINTVDYITISSASNSTDFADLTEARLGITAFSDGAA
jgi:hypothetical protein